MNALRLPVPWRKPLAILALLQALLLAAYWHTAVGMVAIWSRSETYAHGFVVPFIALWLAWRLRAALAHLVPRPGRFAWLPMLGAALLWLAGDLVAVNAATQLALVALMVLAVPAVLGWQVARVLVFPLGFLFFAVPLGDFMLPRLMDWTAHFTVLALRASGIPVYQEGLQFVIPSGRWSVVAACSGIRYLIASVTVGSLFAYLSYQSTRKRLLFVAFAIVVPLVANWVRAYLIVLLGHVSGNELATGVDHLIYGWVFFGLVIAVMFWVGARWSDPAPPAGRGLSGAASQSFMHEIGLKRPSIMRYALTFLIVMVPQLVLAVVDLSRQTQPVHWAAPAVVAPWRAAAAPPSSWEPAFQNAAATFNAGVVDPQGQPVGVHISYYRLQDYQRKLVSSDNVFVAVNDPAWERARGIGSMDARLQGAALRVQSAVLRPQVSSLGQGSERFLVWRFYWVNGRFTASDLVGKLQGALGRISGWGDDGANIALYTPWSDAEPQAEAAARLQAYLNSQGDALVAALQQTRKGD